MNRKQLTRSEHNVDSTNVVMKSTDKYKKDRLPNSRSGVNGQGMNDGDYCNINGSTNTSLKYAVLDFNKDAKRSGSHKLFRNCSSKRVHALVDTQTSGVPYSEIDFNKTTSLQVVARCRTDTITAYKSQ